MSKFRLQPVLKLRQHAEDERKRDLARALAEEQRRKDAVLRLAESRRDQVELLRGGQRAAELDVRGLIEHRQYIGLLEREIHLELRHVALAEHETEARRRGLVEARRNRKALDVLRSRFDERQRQRAEKLESAETDEGASMVIAAARAAECGGRP
jgi:flagellar export protein FliJ